MKQRKMVYTHRRRAWRFLTGGALAAAVALGLSACAPTYGESPAAKTSATTKAKPAATTAAVPEKKETPQAADMKLGALFSDHMVLQRGVKLPVWGWTTPGQAVIVSLNGKSATATAGQGGKWTATLPAMDAGGPYELVVKGASETKITDVLIGDVWVCSGQSNMEWPVRNTVNAEAEAAAANLPQLRQFRVNKKIGFVPEKDVTGSWAVAAPETVPHWTAVGFYFGRDLQKHLNVPIGLINTSWGGTRVEAWTSVEMIKKIYPEADLKEIADRDEVAQQADAINALAKTREAERKEAYKKLVALETDTANQAKYSDPNLDDSGWKEIKAPSPWEKEGHPDLDGEVWYRKTVTIPAEWAGKDLALRPGPVDEIETTYFNGVKVGGMGSLTPLVVDFWNEEREYKVPADLVKPGKAVVAIRVVDQKGEGGLWGGAAEKMLIRPMGAPGTDKGISLSGMWKHEVALALPVVPKAVNPNLVSVLYNGMIGGLIPYGIKGAIWYQGESNAGKAYIYRDRFAAMIQDWRARWGSDFPFFWVSLANFNKDKNIPGDPGSTWAVLRESQSKTLSLPNTGTALAIDIGEADNIHPKNKQDVGYRLALAARKVAYGETIVHSGPTYKSMKVEGGAIRVSFDNVGGGLVAKDRELKKFAIAGADKKWVWASAKIDGTDVVVSSPEVAAPMAVRYAWANNPEGCNLYNKEGLPADPFRTDDWEVVTQPAK